MLKVLQVLKGGDAFGGVESFLYQYYANLDHTKISFDFVFCVGDTMKDRWNDPVLKNSQHTSLAIKERDMMQLYLRLNDYLKTNKYDCIHINTGNISIQVPVLIAARRNGIRIRIAHSHSVGKKGKKGLLKSAITTIMQKIIVHYSTKMAACSVEAAEHLFGRRTAQEKTLIVPNAIDVKKYTLSSTLRDRKREELGVGNRKVYIQVGNLVPVKNHEFTINMFKELLEHEADSVLLFAGKGELESILKKTVKELGIENSVIFLGYRNDVNELLQVADIMLMPSKWEGFPMAVIEAQVSGMTVLCSNTIPHSVNVTGKCIFLPLDIERWKMECMSASTIKEDYTKLISECGYDIETATNNFFALYTE
jgi:glycosyltransferase involved in cell wall biosynthesis